MSKASALETIQKAREEARKHEQMCSIAADMLSCYQNDFNAAYRKPARDEDGNYIHDNDGYSYIYEDKTPEDWGYDDFLIAKEIFTKVEKTICDMCRY